jgi:hypothetical protein
MIYVDRSAQLVVAKQSCCPEPSDNHRHLATVAAATALARACSR